jgi:asparagine synthase (glutamine-hydrolysing)
LNRLVFRRGRGPGSLAASLGVVPHPPWERVDQFNDGDVSIAVATYPTHALDRGQAGLSIDDEWVVAVDGHVARSSELARRLGGVAATTVELVRAAVGRYGEHAAAQLDGDFALVAYHRPSRRTVIAVDRFGTRQLHASALEGNLSVASEPLCALRAVGRPFEPDLVVTAQMLVGCAITRERSLYRGVATMAAGTTRVLNANGVSEDHVFFRSEPTEAPPRSLRAAIEIGGDALARAVRARCEGSLQVGVLTSGGLDSTIIAALASRACVELGLPRPVLFHVSAAGFSADERPFAQRLADVLGLEIVVRDIREGEEVGDRPLREFHGLTAPAFMRLFEVATSRGVGVMLTGEGGDELQFPTGCELDDLLAAKQWRAAARFARRVGSRIRPRLRLALRAGLRGWLPRFLLEERAVSRALATLPTWLTEKGRRHVHDAIVERHAAAFEQEHPMPHKQAIAAHYAWSPSMTILYQLQNALAARSGVELRHPFFDERVCDAWSAFPTSLLVSSELEKPFLRELCATLLPRDLAFRPPPTDYACVHRSLWSQRFPKKDMAGLSGTSELVARGLVALTPLLDDLGEEDPSFESLQTVLATLWLADLRRTSERLNGSP